MIMLTPFRLMVNVLHGGYMKRIVLGMLAHVDAGKTTLSEGLLYTSGSIRKLGRVDNRDAFLDTAELERKRGITIFSKQAKLATGELDVTLLDTPGHVDFSAEMERTLQVLDYAVLIISGPDGVQSHTETLWRLLARYSVPVFVFVNKMDQAGTNSGRVLEQLKNRLSPHIEDFSNPDMEEIVLCDEGLMEDYLESGELDFDRLPGLIADRRLFPCYFGSALRLDGVPELLDGIEKYTLERDYPDEFGAKVFKIARDEQGNRLTYMKVTGGTLCNRMAVGDEKVNQIRIYSGDRFKAVESAQAGEVCAVLGLDATAAGQSIGTDCEAAVPMLTPVLTYRLNLPQGVDALEMLPKLRLLEEEDPQLHVTWDELNRELHIQVMGAIQMEVLQNQIATRFGVDVTLDTGRIVYKETIADTVLGVGHFEPLRHYAEVHLLMEPGEPGSGIQCDVGLVNCDLATNWQRLVMTHVNERTHRGVLTGAPLTDVRITLVSGRAHAKHTEGGDFRQATYRAVRQGLMQAKSVLLEPYYDFTLRIPSENVGRAMTDLDRMHATFSLENTGQTADMACLTGSLPVACLGEYQLELAAYTRGMGRLDLRMKGYAPCHNTEEVVAQTGYDSLADTRNSPDSVFCSQGSGELVPWNQVFTRMHLPDERKILRGNGGSPDGEHAAGAPGTDEASVVAAARRRALAATGRAVSDEPLGTDEIDAIINSTFYANRKSGSKKYGYKRKKIYNDTASPATRTYGKTEQKKQYLLVDGYNVIHAWQELDELARDNFDGARGRLLDILCNYQAFKGCELIVVFDAYKVKGHDTEMVDYNNIHVVYTKEAETADQYIEKFAHDNASRYQIRVATSDGLEQIIIRGEGCLLVSAREFEAEVMEAKRQMGEIIGSASKHYEND